MDKLLAVTAFVTVAAVTPGPNNLVVMAAAARGGRAAAVPAIVGVIAGSLALLVLVWAGAGAAFAAAPRLRALLAIAGVAYLVWLGAGMIWRAGRVSRETGAALPQTAAGLAAFQVLNPKSWVLVLTATAILSGDGPASLAALAAVFAIVCGACLTLWAVAGSALAAWVARPWFDRAMGGLLVGSAALVVV